MITCGVVGCKREIRAKSLCRMHYGRLRRTGSVGEAETRRINYRELEIDWTDPEQVKDYRRTLAKKWRIKTGYKSIGSMHKTRFGGVRILVLERDNYTCQICEMTDEEHREKWDRQITVDHIDGEGRYSMDPHNEIENLWTLCLSCHGSRDSIRNWISKGKEYSNDKMELYKL